MSRPIWKGSISFGLVNIPIQLETAVREKTVRFHMLTKDGTCRLRQKLYCPETGKEFAFNETARGIEIAPEQYVLMDEKEISKLKPVRGRAIEIQEFVELSSIDPIYFDRVYFVVPAEEAIKAFKLFHEALRESGRIALARFVMHDREHLAAIRTMSDGLVLHTMHYADEVLAMEDALPKSLGRTKAAAAELKIAKQLIEGMSQPVDLAKYKDDYREELETLIEKKRAGKKTVAVSDDHGDEPLPRTINLMEALKKSLAEKKPAKPGTRHYRKSA